jgi:hypothetical protein
MDVDVPKWKGEIIAGWKGDEDEVVNIDDEDGGLGGNGCFNVLCNAGSW